MKKSRTTNAISVHLKGITRIGHYSFILARYNVKRICCTALPAFSRNIFYNRDMILQDNGF